MHPYGLLAIKDSPEESRWVIFQADRRRGYVAMGLDQIGGKEKQGTQISRQHNQTSGTWDEDEHVKKGSGIERALSSPLLTSLILCPQVHKLCSQAAKELFHRMENNLRWC